jgi:hypothetical protein
VTVGENENHAQEFSKSLRDSIKIINAKIACGPDVIYQYHESQKAQCRDPRTLRKPGRLSKKNDFYRPNLA